MKRTCAECPWKRSSSSGKFLPEQYEALTSTCEPGGLPGVFACHMTPAGEERACAGFLIVHGADNNRVRIAMIAGAWSPGDSTADGPLYGSFAEMSCANGFDPEARVKEARDG